MKKKILVFGDGGHFKVVFDIFSQEQKSNVIQIIETGQALLQSERNLPWASEDELFEMINIQPCEVFIAIGDNSIRKMLFEKVNSQGIPLVNALVSDHSIVSPSATIGQGTVVMPGAIINARAVVGNNCIINTGAIVEHDCIIGPHSHLAPSSTLTGGVIVGDQVFIGAGTTVLPNVNVGRMSTIGAGSVVTKNVPEGHKVYGVPASVKKSLGG